MRLFFSGAIPILYGRNFRPTSVRTFRRPEVVAFLHVQPKFRTGAEGAGQTQRPIRTDSGSFVDNGGERLAGHPRRSAREVTVRRNAFMYYSFMISLDGAAGGSCYGSGRSPNGNPDS